MGGKQLQIITPRSSPVHLGIEAPHPTLSRKSPKEELFPKTHQQRKLPPHKSTHFLPKGLSTSPSFLQTTLLSKDEGAREQTAGLFVPGLWKAGGKTKPQVVRK